LFWASAWGLLNQKPIEFIVVNITQVALEISQQGDNENFWKQTAARSCQDKQ
jgi:hypothetical protein